MKCVFVTVEFFLAIEPLRSAFMNRVVLALLLVAMPLGTAAQTKYPRSINLGSTPSATKAMTANDVIKLSQAGVSDDIIIGQIKKQGCVVLSTEDILQLSKDGVSKRVIQTMIDPNKIFPPEKKASPPPPAPEVAAKQAPAPDKDLISAVWPIGPPPTASPLTASIPATKPLAGDKPRVFVAGRGTLNIASSSTSAAYGNWWSGGVGVLEASSGETNFDAHDETMELAKDLGRSCPAVVVTVNKTMADYAVSLNRESKRKRGLFRDNSQVLVINREGTVLMGNSTHTVAGSAKDACNSILEDWQRDHAPQVRPPVPN